MSVTGLCQVCERERADYQCDRCGALVCNAHYDPETGFCTECAADVRGGRSDAGGGPR